MALVLDWILGSFNARRQSAGISHSVPLQEPDIISECGLRSNPADSGVWYLDAKVWVWESRVMNWESIVGTPLKGLILGDCHNWFLYAHALAEQAIERELVKSRILFSGYWRAPVHWSSCGPWVRGRPSGPEENHKLFKSALKRLFQR